MAEEKYNRKNPAVKRILQEVKEMQSNPSDDFMSLPLEENIFEWQFAIVGPRDTEFEGGIYHGRIQLPAEYPFQPPAFMLLTPNGRFETQTKICLSISNHHPEHWQPSWSVRTALVALIAFMPTNPEGALGSLDFKKEERQALAIKSREAPPKFGSPERQKLIDEIHQYMLSKVPPVPKLSMASPCDEITSNGEGEPDASPEIVDAMAAREEHPEPQLEAEAGVVGDVREVSTHANYGSLQVSAGIKFSRTVPAADTSELQAQPPRPADRARAPVNDRIYTWAAIGLAIAILVLIVKKVLRANGYASFMDDFYVSD